MPQRYRSFALVATLVLVSAWPLVAQEEPNLTEEEKRQFLLTAKVINSKQTSKGVTAPWRLTLRSEDGKLTHDAAFQSIDERKTTWTSSTGRTEMNFRDTFHFNIAAWELSKLLGLDHMMPVTVERKWNGKTGSLSWWLPIQMDEVDRMKKGLQPPDPDAWNKQMYRKRVFAELAYDTDPNMTNLLIGHDWKIYMIDFGRAFRLFPDLANAKNIVRCDRQLLEKLKALKEDEILERTKGHLSKSEVKAVMQRRDKILALVQQLIAQKGESEVLY